MKMILDPKKAILKKFPGKSISALWSPSVKSMPKFKAVLIRARRILIRRS